MILEVTRDKWDSKAAYVSAKGDSNGVDSPGRGQCWGGVVSNTYGPRHQRRGSPEEDIPGSYSQV